MTVADLVREFPQDTSLLLLNQEARVIVDDNGLWWTAELTGRKDADGKSEVVFKQIGRLILQG